MKDTVVKLSSGRIKGMLEMGTKIESHDCVINVLSKLHNDDCNVGIWDLINFACVVQQFSLATLGHFSIFLRSGLVPHCLICHSGQCLISDCAGCISKVLCTFA